MQLILDVGGCNPVRKETLSASIILTTSVAAVHIATSLAAAPRSRPTTRFPSEVSVVAVDVVVLDEEKNPIHGLGKDDFLLTEDGMPQEVSSFEAIEVGAPIAGTEELPAVSSNVVAAGEVGRAFAIVFDGVHLTPGGAEHAKKAIRQFLKEDVRDGDSISLLSTTGGVFGSANGVRGRDRLIRLLEELRGERINLMPPGVSISDFEAKRIAEDRDPYVAAMVWKRLVLSGATHDPNARYTQGAGTSPGASLDRMIHPEVEMYASQIYDVVRKRRRLVLETIKRVLESLTTRRGRKSLLLVSEGFVADMQTEGMREVAEAARRANTAVYFLDARGLMASNSDLVTGVGQIVGENAVESANLGLTDFGMDAESDGADRLTDETGGFSVKNTNDLSRGFERINRESTAHYLLGYRSTNQDRDGTYRKIRVNVSRKGVEVRARKGYYAPGPASERSKKHDDEEKDESLPLLQKALDAPFQIETIPLRMSAYVLGEAAEGKANVVIAADVDVDALAFERHGDRYVDRLGFLVVILDLESGEHARSNQKIDMRLTAESLVRYQRQWYSVLRDFQLASGSYQAKVIVLDENSRRVGSVMHEFRVPELAEWHISTPVLSDTVEALDSGGATRLVPLARRVFSSQGRLYCWFMVFGAAQEESTGQPAVITGFSLQTDKGREILREDPAAIVPDSDGRLSRLIDIPLDGLSSGDYNLVLDLEDRAAGARQQRREPLTITARGS
jgi:VWFA-related protein